jgi:hypothetical protein
MSPVRVDKYRPQRTMTYVAFDGDADMDGYKRIKLWSADSRVPFEFRDAHDLYCADDNSLTKSIINQLRKRMHLSANVVLIVSDITAQNRKGSSTGRSATRCATSCRLSAPFAVIPPPATTAGACGRPSCGRFCHRCCARRRRRATAWWLP